MSHPYSMDYDDPVLAELYDQSVTEMEDIRLLLRVLDGPPRRVLEVFSGTGRLAVPLAEAGYLVTCLEMASAMNHRHRDKLRMKGLSDSVLMIEGDAFAVPWGTGYDAVVLGGNAMYELPSSEAQLILLRTASRALKRGGLLFLDNDNLRKPLTREDVGETWVSIRGVTQSGAAGELASRVVDINVAAQVQLIERTWTVTDQDGVTRRRVYTGRKHPVSAVEVRQQLAASGFVVVKAFGGYREQALEPESGRAIFLARRTKS